MATMQKTTLVGPARAWRSRHGRYGLVGGYCGACQAYSYPADRTCKKCGAAAVSPRAMSGAGHVICAAEDHTPLMGHGGRSTRPFAMIRLEEGPVVMAEIVDIDFDDIVPEMPVEMVVRKWRPEPTGLPLYGFKFRKVL